MLKLGRLPMKLAAVLQRKIETTTKYGKALDNSKCDGYAQVF